jgi:hypothetical protein
MVAHAAGADKLTDKLDAAVELGVWSAAVWSAAFFTQLEPAVCFGRKP